MGKNKECLSLNPFLVRNVAVNDGSETVILKLSIEEGLRKVTPREAEAIKLLYGIDDGIERTPKEVGMIMGVTRQRVSSLEKQALKKIKDFLS